MKKFFQKLTFFKTLHHLLVAKALLLPILLFLPHKTHAIGPIVAGLMGLLGSGLKGLAEGTVEAGASLITLALSVGILSYIAFSLAKFLLWLAATVFNWSMETMVFGFSAIFGDSGGMLLAWSTLRDIGNIVLLFGFLYIGIQMILNVAHFNAKQTLPRLLIAAILINFSLFISGAIIDITNGISSTFDSEQVGGDSCQGTGEGDEAGCRLNNGIAGQILGQLNIISVVSGVSGVGAENVDVVGDAATYFSNPISSTITFVALAILVMLAAVVLFAGAFLIIARGITLAFLLVVSPIGFVGMAIEPLHGISERWWKALIDNALFAPIFIILLFVGLRLTDSLKDSVQVEGGLVTALTSGDGLMAGPVFLFMLVIGFMVAALTFARSAGVIGSEQAVKFATSFGTSATTFPFLPARNFISERSEKYGKAYERRVAPVIRKLPVFGKDIETVVGAGLGKTFDAGKNVSLAGWGTKPAWDESVKKRGEHLKHEQHKVHLENSLKEGIANARMPQPDFDLIEKVVNDEMSLADLKDTEPLKKGTTGIGEIARALKPSRFRQIMDDDKVDSGIKDTMRDERFGEFIENVQNSPRDPVAAKKVRSVSADDIEMSGLLRDPAQRAVLMRTISDTQFDNLMKKDLGSTTEQKLKALRNGTDPNGRFGTSQMAQRTLNGVPNGPNGMNAKKRAKLPSSTLVNQNVLPHLQNEDFLQIALENDMDPQDKPTLVAHVRRLLLQRGRGSLDHYLQTVGGEAERKARAFFA